MVPIMYQANAVLNAQDRGFAIGVIQSIECFFPELKSSDQEFRAKFIRVYTQGIEDSGLEASASYWADEYRLGVEEDTQSFPP